MFCVKCGAEIEDGTQFCPQCGATQEPPVAAPAEPVYNAAPAAAPAGSSKSLVALILGIASIVLPWIGRIIGNWGAIIFAIIGLVVAIVGLSMSKKARAEDADAGIDPATDAKAKVGKILSIIGLIMCIVIIVWAIIALIAICALKAAFAAY